MSGVLTALAGILPSSGGGGGGGGGFALVNHLEYSPNGAAHPFTTGSVNMTGANLIVVFAGTYKDWYVSSIVDSNGNSYTGTTKYAGSAQAAQFFYKVNPTGSLSALTFTITGVSSNINLYSYFGVMGFSGGSTAVLDQQNGGTDSVDPLQTGSITPSVDNSLVLASIFNYNGGGVPTCSAMTAMYGVAKSGSIGMGGAGYVVQTTATAINATIVSTGAAGGENGLAIISFKP